jgi:hypothetical protein
MGKERKEGYVFFIKGLYVGEENAVHTHFTPELMWRGNRFVIAYVRC